MTTIGNTRLRAVKEPTRRDFLASTVTAAASVVLAGCGVGGPLAAPQSMGARSSPQCEAKVPPTRSDIEGPYYKAGAPQNRVLAPPAEAGVRLSLRGRTLDTCLRILPGARIDVWQANDGGSYDTTGFHLRGVLSSHSDGAYSVNTIIPGRYLNGSQYRPAHIHVKVSAPGFVPLTTQLYLEGDPFNAIDPFFNAALMLRPTDAPDGSGAKEAVFDFILSTQR